MTRYFIGLLTHAIICLFTASGSEALLFSTLIIFFIHRYTDELVAFLKETTSEKEPMENYKTKVIGKATPPNKTSIDVSDGWVTVPPRK